jgi:formate C-acetyltransferase
MEESAVLRKSRRDESCWRDFAPGMWLTEIDVCDFIVRNVTAYAGDESFLAGPSNRTKAVWAKLKPYFQDEQKKGACGSSA